MTQTKLMTSQRRLGEEQLRLFSTIQVRNHSQHNIPTREKKETEKTT